MYGKVGKKLAAKRGRWGFEDGSVRTARTRSLIITEGILT